MCVYTENKISKTKVIFAEINIEYKNNLILQKPVMSLCIYVCETQIFVLFVNFLD